MKELLVRARTHEVARDRAMKQDPYFDYAGLCCRSRSS